jgi:hypothetical protein
MSGAKRPLNNSSARGNAVTTGRSKTVGKKTMTAVSRYSDGGVGTNVTVRDRKGGKETMIGGNWADRPADAKTPSRRSRQQSAVTGDASKKVLGSYAKNYFKKNSK